MTDWFDARLTRRAALAAGGLLGLELLTGCSNVARQGASTTGKKGGNFVIGQINDIDLKAVATEGNTNNVSWLGLVFNRLTEYERPTLNIKPMLATSWKASSDGLSLQLHLRSDVKFHTGRPFGPDDVMWNIKHLQDPAAASQFQNTTLKITDMSADGPNTVTLRFSQPISDIFDLFEFMDILDQETFSDFVTGKQVVGTGPFKWGTWTPNDSLVLNRNPGYWESGLPYFDSVTMRVIPQATSMLAALQTGEIDLVIDPSPKDLGPFQTSKFKIDNDHAGDVNYYIGFNLKVKPFDQAQVRQAIAYAIDGKRINDQVLQGRGTVTSLPWPKSSPAYDASLVDHFAYDPNKAKSMLSAAGVSGLKAVLTLDNGLPATVDMGQIVQSNLQDVGIDVSISLVQPAQIGTYLRNATFPGIFLIQTPFGNLQPATLIEAAFPYESGKNASNFVDPDYVSAANSLWTARTTQEVKQAAAAVNRILLDQLFVYTFLQGTIIYVRPSNVLNIRYGMNKHPYLQNASFS